MNRFYRTIKKLFGGLFGFLLRVKVINPEKEITDKPFIICCNHTSAYDPFVLSLAMKNQIRYMAKKEAFRFPLVRSFLISFGAFPVDRKHSDVSAIKKTIEILKSGGCVGIFPQGTRKPKVNPRETEIKNGIGLMASKANVGILPVYIKTRKNKVRLFRRTYLIIGDYISPEEFPGSLGAKERFKEISEHAFSQSCTLGEEFLLK